MLGSDSASSFRISRDNSNFNHTRITISTKSGKLAEIAQLDTLIKMLNDDAAFYEGIEENLKRELAKATT